ncbi:hypothetical protein GGI35DRAFT_284917 [Trichoderma velutinum]
MTQSETPPPQRQSHPTSSNLRHSGHVLRDSAARCYELQFRLLALQQSSLQDLAGPASLSLPLHTLFFFPFFLFLRLVLFLL